MIKMDAVVLAGGKMALDDPLYAQGVDGSRSLVDVLGKPMVQWVVDALDASDCVAEMYVIGLPTSYRLKATKPVHYLPDQGDIFENIRCGVVQATQDHPSRSKVLIASSDIPAIQPSMIDWLASEVAADPGLMMYYNVVEQSTMEARFPQSNRSYVRFKDIAVCGGDLNVIDKSLFAEERLIWQKLANARKHPLKQAGLLGIDSLIMVALHILTLEGAVKRVCKRLGIKAKALRCPHAEIAMDADKPHQLAILRQHLEERV
ncbi:MAG: NTP transferase domain-containing protein [Brevefilum sp.]|nr:NTP transferase domain-containing protein [Brevefilum sp.]